MDATGLLSALLSADDAMRRSAETALEAAQASSPDAVVAAFTQVLCSDADVARREMAAVLLRRSLVAGTLCQPPMKWASLSAATQSGLKAGLLHALAHEAVMGVRKKVAHTVAEIASTAISSLPAEGVDPASAWPELLPAVFAHAAGDNAPARVAALYTLQHIFECTGGLLIVAAGGGPGGQLVAFLARALSDTEPDARTNALQVAAAVIANLEDATVRDEFKALVPGMVGVLGASFSIVGEEATAQEVLKALIGVVGAQPHFFRAHLEQACTAMLQIINHSGLEADTRKLGLEFLLSLAENAGATLRKLPKLVEAILSLTLGFLSQEPDSTDEEWALEDDVVDNFMGEECDELFGAGMAACDRLANAIGGKQLLPLFFAQVQPMLSSTNWLLRRAALVAIALILEGCRRALAPTLRSLVSNIITFLDDPHPRVRHAAVRTIGQMAIDFGDEDALGETTGGALGEVAASVVAGSKGGAGAAAAASVAARARAAAAASTAIKSLQEVAADIVLPALIAAAGPKNALVPRVRGLAAASAVGFLQGDHLTSELLTSHADALLNALFRVLQEVPPTFHHSRGSALTAIGLAAAVLDEDFSKYYSLVMPGLKAVVSDTTDTSPGAVTLRGKALECLSFVANAVGKAQSGLDAAECLNAIIKAQQAGFKGDDSESFGRSVDALLRLSDCLGADFGPYIPYTVPFLLGKASTKIEFKIINGGDDAAEVGPAGGQTATFTFKDGSGDTSTIAVDSTAMSEKISSLGGLVGLVHNLGVEVPAFWPCLDPIASVISVELSEGMGDALRLAVIASSALFTAAVADTSGDGTHGQRMLDGFLPQLGSLLARSCNTDVIFACGEVLSDMTQLAYNSTQPGWSGPEGVPEGTPPGTYKPIVIPLTALTLLCEHFAKAFEASNVRRCAVAQDVGENPDADEEDADKLAGVLEEEDELITRLTDAVGYCIKTHKQAMLPILSLRLGPEMLKWLDVKDVLHLPMRASAICLADDLIEHATPGSLALLDQVVPVLLDAAQSSNPLLRHPSLYGLGVCAQMGGPAFEPHVPSACSVLAAALRAPDARSPDNVFASDNAMSSLIKCARFRSHAVDGPSIMREALAYLPLKGDGIEARLVHGWMITGLGAMDPLWLGPGGAHARALLSALARTLIAHERNMAKGGEGGGGGEEDEDEDEDELVEERSLASLPGIGAALRASPQAAAVAAVNASLPPAEREALGHYGLSFDSR